MSIPLSDILPGTSAHAADVVGTVVPTGVFSREVVNASLIDGVTGVVSPLPEHIKKMAGQLVNAEMHVDLWYGEAQHVVNQFPGGLPAINAFVARWPQYAEAAVGPYLEAASRHSMQATMLDGTKNELKQALDRIAATIQSTQHNASEAAARAFIRGDATLGGNAHLPNQKEPHDKGSRHW